MNLLKALFSSEMEQSNFFDTTYPLTTHFVNEDWPAWAAEAENLAVVKSDIYPGQLGHVKYQGVRWRACCDRPLTLTDGTPVKVLGRRANILVVEPMTACVLN